MTIGDWLRGAQERLTESGCPDPRVDSRWIAEDTLGLTAKDLTFEALRDIDPERLEVLNARLERRVNGEPVQYILENANFMGLNFHVDRRVLIPRQDTETLVEALVVELRGREKPRLLDLCAGSGAIGLSAASLAPDAQVTLTDLSREALEVARANARALGVDAEIRHGDLFRAVGRDRFDVIASNPPYIPSGDMAGLQREVRSEPAMALDGGSDGLDFYRRIAADCSAHLTTGGSIYLEVGIGQAEAVRAMIAQALVCQDSGILNDLNGIPRVVWARSV